MPLPPRFALLQVTPRLDSGGVERTTVDIARAVVAAGGRALVASAGGRLESELADVGGELVRLAVDSKNPLVQAGLAGSLRRLIQAEGVSLVHARSRAPAFAAACAARAAHVPFVTTYAGIYNAGSGLKRWYNGVMARADLVIANSAYTRAHILAQHRVAPERVITIPRGVDLARFDAAAVSAARIGAVRNAWGLPADESRPVVLLAGRLTRWKGQGLMVEALARLKTLGAPLPLVVMVGEGEGGRGFEGELKRTIAAAGLESAVRLVGHCADMPAAYLCASLAAAPSLDPEAFGRTAVEPQAMERPVLASDHGAAAETVADGETGWLVAPGDANAWADALHFAFAAGPSVWVQMGRAGRARVARLYSLEAMTAATLEAYAALLASKAPAAR